MSVEIKAPQFPESVADGTVATWHKKVGEPVARDELLVDIETDKIVLEVVAPSDGKLEKIFKKEGEVIDGGAVLALFVAGEVSQSADVKTVAPENKAVVEKAEDDSSLLSPAVRKMISEHKLDARQIAGSGKGGRILKEDIQAFLATKEQGRDEAVLVKESVTAVAEESKPAKRNFTLPPGGIVLPDEDRVEKRVPMTRLRARIAERLIQVQQEAAMLTTFNEVNMKPIMDMRKNYKDAFSEMHGVKLGFMSFFVLAATEALKRFQVMNA
jgi:2-oxoglutarate dehydrogenase E2 component (dihydrolipoamide succinyltransferase)